MADKLPAVDKALRCATCGDGFVFTSGEQELFRLRGITTEPGQCSHCARGRVLSTPLNKGYAERASR